MIDISWVRNPVDTGARLRNAIIMEANHIVDFSGWPISSQSDRIEVFYNRSIKQFRLQVTSGNAVHEIGRYDGVNWLWCRTKGFQSWSEIIPGIVRSDAEAFCLCVYRHSGEFCGNQALSDFNSEYHQSFWKDTLKQIEPLFQISFVLFE